MAIPGNFTLRALAANVTKFIAISGLPGSIPIESAGTNSGAVPHWKAITSETYETDNWSFHLTQNWVSAGVQNREWVQCAIGSCPVTTDFTNHPTVNDNHVAGIIYLAFGGTYNITPVTKAYFQVDNALNKSPPIIYSTNNNNVNGSCGCDGNPLLYDTVGRMMHVGIRIQN
jgi:iron complex outermembrane receptor protein